jgi:hypothetical protein
MGDTLALLPQYIRMQLCELLPLIRAFAIGDYGIALGGAHAKGVADEDSDLDIYLFAQAVLPNAERRRLMVEFSSEITDICCWGEDTNFTQAGSDFRFRGLLVENWARNSAMIDTIIAECEQGIVKRDLVCWTITGFYNHCCLSDIKVMMPLEDPAGIIARWKERVAVYPPKLRRAIIEQHLAEARFWPENPHYHSAIKRADVIYTTGIVQQVVHNLLQVLFAINETYFPGDKKLREALEHLSKLPEGFLERLDFLLWPAAPVTEEVLWQQQKELTALMKELATLSYSI